MPSRESGAGRRRTTRAARSDLARAPREDLEPDPDHPRVDHAERERRLLREVDDPAADEGAAVVDHAHHLASVLEVGDPHPGAEREPGVGGGHALARVDGPARRGLAVEAGAVPRGQPALPRRAEEVQHRAPLDGAEEQDDRGQPSEALGRRTGPAGRPQEGGPSLKASTRATWTACQAPAPRGVGTPRWVSSRASPASDVTPTACISWTSGST